MRRRPIEWSDFDTQKPTIQTGKPMFRIPLGIPILQSGGNSPQRDGDSPQRGGESPQRDGESPQHAGEWSRLGHSKIQHSDAKTIPQKSRCFIFSVLTLKTAAKFSALCSAGSARPRAPPRSRDPIAGGKGNFFSAVAPEKFSVSSNFFLPSSRNITQ